MRGSLSLLVLTGCTLVTDLGSSPDQETSSGGSGVGGQVPAGGGGQVPVTGGGGMAGAEPWEGQFQLLVTSQSDASIKVYDQTGALVRSISVGDLPTAGGGGSGGAGGGPGLAPPAPLDAAVAPDGNLLVAVPSRHEIARFTMEGTELAPLASVETPFGLTVDEGTVFVCDHLTGTVRSFDALTGEDFGSFEPHEGSGGIPNDVAVRDGQLYVALWNFGAVEVFDLTTRVSMGYFRQGYPTTTAIDFGPDGDLYVAYLSGLVQRYDGTTGELTAEVVSGGPASLGIAFGPDEGLYVATSESAVRRYTASGMGGEYFVQPSGGGLYNPYHIAFVPPEWAR
jgi:DNA-binding beta-propeller fold protein YncE